MRTILTYASLFPLALISACYSPTIADGQQQCSPAGTCASGFTCAADKKCYKTGETIGCKTTCTGATPKCDTSNFTCVGCLADSDCPAGDLCKGKTCLAGCSAAHMGCGADAGSCDVDMGVCRGCSGDSECPMATPRCDSATGSCQPCLPAKDNCPSGQYCTAATTGHGYQCAMGCKIDGDCASADGGAGTVYCCNHQCSDVSSDANNCGACGKPCNPDGGAGTLACCSAKCTDPSTDLNNCGGCNLACAPKNATGMCASSSCNVASCTTGFKDCDHLASTGCEINSLTDPMNCGACNNTCPTVANGMGGCAMGTCGIGKCNTGFADCDKTLSNGCEKNVLTDLSNCGGCGMTCTIANGTAGCAMGACTVASCTAPFRDCNAKATDGCEVDLSKDLMNCGACGNACKVGTNVQAASCVASTCGIASCLTGFSDCNMSATDGCERNLQTDSNNCGKCGAVCALTASATAVSCTSGSCAVATCAANTADCNKSYSDGCETNTQTDANNCGSCGNKCPSSAPYCLSGMCTNAIVWSGSFTQNSMSVTQPACGDWDIFRAKLTGNSYTSINIKGSLDTVGVTCNNNTAAVLAITNALRTTPGTGSSTPTANVSCNGRQWMVCSCFGGGGPVVELGVGFCCNGSENYDVRACYPNQCWGNANPNVANSCGAATQTITVTVF